MRICNIPNKLNARVPNNELLFLHIYLFYLVTECLKAFCLPIAFKMYFTSLRYMTAFAVATNQTVLHPGKSCS